MPFITEELYQRLPHSDATKYSSISIAPYPEIVSIVNNYLIYLVYNNSKSTIFTFR